MTTQADLDPLMLRRFAGSFPTGVAILTTRNQRGDLFGATLNSVTSLSLAPPLYLMCLDAGSRTLSAITESGIFCLNFLSAHQHQLAKLFASKVEDKFSLVDYALAANGAPVLSECLAGCLGSVTDSHPGGDHSIIVGHVSEVTSGEGEPLVFYRGQFQRIAPHPEASVSAARARQERASS